MSTWLANGIATPAYQSLVKTGGHSNTPPPAPKTSAHYPAGLRPTTLTAEKHPNTAEVVKQVNDFYLENWPFKTEKHRKRFVDEGYAWFVCLNCPLSLDERMHWGCRLLTIGFLIDDVLDSMSVEDGVAYNSKVIECARGNLLPDRNVPGQWIMYDLFEGMRAVDKQLADELLEPTIDFLLAQVDGNRIKPMTLNEYFDYRDADLGKG
jgi:aristolochene synthase